jgi:hypothetical protein
VDSSNMKKTFSFFKIAILTLLIILPSFSFAAVAIGRDLIPCGGPAVPEENIPAEDSCTFEHVLQLIENAINFALNYLFFPLFVIAVVYAGYLLMMSGDNPGNRKKAKDIFVNILIGLLLVLAAWLIVKLVLVGLGYDSTIFSTFY